MATDAASVIATAQCLMCFGPTRYQVRLMKLALLVQLVTKNFMATDPASLLAQANCFACFGANEYMLDLMELALLVQLVQGGGIVGGGGVQCGNYAGGQPNFTPSSGCGNAIDTSNGQIWWYYNGAWH